MDATGGTNYAMIGTTQMMSVPYALYAKSAGIDSTMLANMIGSSGGGMGGGCNFKYPDGLDGEFITTSINPNSSSQNNYTVPTGKILYISTVHKTAASNTMPFEANGIELLTGSMNNGNGGSITNPFIFEGGDILEGHISFNGILITNSNITSITYSLTAYGQAQTNYVVPSGKSLHITQVKGSVAVNGTGLMESSNDGGYDYNLSLANVINASSGDVISGFGYDDAFNGYLADENYFAGCGGGGSSSSASAVDSAMVAGMIANSGGGGSFGEWELIFEDLILPGNINTQNVKWGQVSKDGFLYLMDKSPANLGTIYTYTDENILDTLNLLNMSKRHDFRVTNTNYYETKLIPIKANSFWSMSIPGSHALDLYFLPLESGGGGSSSASAVSNATIDSLSQVVSNLDSSLTVLTSQFNFGCTDATACNYDATANFNDGSCLSSGCTSPTAINYDATVTCDDGSCAYGIGDYLQGGIIAYIDATGLHGLIVSQTDLSATASWGCYGTAISGADGTAIGTGNQNTIDIMNGCSENFMAARLCSFLTLNGYSDWFLPSMDELLEIHYNLGNPAGNLGFFSGSYYWSSTEYNPNQSINAQSLNLMTGQSSTKNKNDLIEIRAVRTF